MINLAANWDTANQIKGVAFNDIYLNEGMQLATVEGTAEMEQTIAHNLQLWKGEYNFDVSLGVPYKLILGNPHLPPGLVTFYLSTMILLINQYMPAEELAAYGVEDISSLALTPDRENRSTLVTGIVRLNNSQSINISAV